MNTSAPPISWRTDLSLGNRWMNVLVSLAVSSSPLLWLTCVKCSLKSGGSTQPKVIHALCWCQKGKHCLQLLLHSQRQCSQCLPASLVCTYQAESWASSSLAVGSSPQTARCAFPCWAASKPKGGKTTWGEENERDWFGWRVNWYILWIAP